VPASPGKRPAADRQISWDGVSFTVPSAWELAVYRPLKRGVMRVELEDTYSMRMEGEWVRKKHPADITLVRQRYAAMVKKMTVEVERQETLVGLPEGWLATYYEVTASELPSVRLNRRPEDRPLQPKRLVTAFYGGGTREPFFACFILWFDSMDPEDPRATLKLLASTLEVQTGPLRRWQAQGLDLTVPADFLLVHTQFDIGLKLMEFRWRWRRFFYWRFSLASTFLPSAPNPETWCSGFLNGWGQINGPRFLPGTRGEVTWKRKRRHVIGHRDELARWCFRYKARCQVVPEGDTLLLWVFHYRHARDVERIPPNLRFGPPLHLADSEPRLPPGLTPA